MNESDYKKLVNCFFVAFKEYKNQDGKIKDIHWFKSEKEKDKVINAG